VQKGVTCKLGKICILGIPIFYFGGFPHYFFKSLITSGIQIGKLGW